MSFRREAVEEYFENLSNIIESIFKMMIWSSFLALFSASLRIQYQSGNYILVAISVIAVVFLSGLLYVWTLAKIVRPFCNLFFRKTNYYKVLENHKNISKKFQRKKIVFAMLKMPENWAVFIVLLSIYLMQSNLFDFMIKFYSTK